MNFYGIINANMLYTQYYVYINLIHLHVQNLYMHRSARTHVCVHISIVWRYFHHLSVLFKFSRHICKPKDWCQHLHSYIKKCSLIIMCDVRMRFRYDNSCLWRNFSLYMKSIFFIWKNKKSVFSFTKFIFIFMRIYSGPCPIHYILKKIVAVTLNS